MANPSLKTSDSATQVETVKHAVKPHGVTHIGVSVTDLQQAIAYYRDVFGFQILWGPTTFSADDPAFGEIPTDFFGKGFKSTKIVFLRGGDGVVLEVFEFEEPKARMTQPNFRYWESGFFHICIVEPDIDDALERIRQHGGRVRSKTWGLAPNTPYRAVYTEDPFGNVIELYSHRTEEILAGL
jgi:catechol 2,3-dioxygenase-like lactoylglutathione lyase family enzyme